MIRCPCCNCLTISEDDEIIVDICPVCFWQYDATCQDYPDLVIGPNRVSLNEAKKNYLAFGAIHRDVMCFVRLPNQDEL